MSPMLTHWTFKCLVDQMDFQPSVNNGKNELIKAPPGCPEVDGRQFNRMRSAGFSAGPEALISDCVRLGQVVLGGGGLMRNCRNQMQFSGCDH